MKSIPLLTVFVLTAIATAGAQVLPAERDLVPLALLLDLVPMGGVAVATALAIRSLRRASLSLVRLLIGAYGYLAGGLVGAFGVSHTVAVAMVAVERASRHEFVYTYRFYSLVLLGALLIVTGLIAAIEAERLARRGSGRRASVWVWTAVLAVNLPLVPLQGFAVLFSVLAAVELLLLTVGHHDWEPAGSAWPSTLPGPAAARRGRRRVSEARVATAAASTSAATSTRR
jgi:hypothetical protein